jgi:hypothetical protein
VTTETWSGGGGCGGGDTGRLQMDMAYSVEMIAC